MCRRLFRRESDKARHKGSSEREQSGAIQCLKGMRGGLWAMEALQYIGAHWIIPFQDISVNIMCCAWQTIYQTQQRKCIVERQKPTAEQQGAVQCAQCQRWFKSRGDWQCTNVKLANHFKLFLVCSRAMWPFYSSGTKGRKECVCLFVCVCMHVHNYVCICLCVRVRVHVRVRVRVCVCACIRERKH